MPAIEHPCGSLPVTGVSLHLWWCPHHQTWWAMATRYTETGEDEIVSEGGSSMQFGPFDSVQDILHWGTEEVAELLLLGVSGDRR